MTSAGPADYPRERLGALIERGGTVMTLASSSLLVPCLPLVVLSGKHPLPLLSLSPHYPSQLIPLVLIIVSPETSST